MPIDIQALLRLWTSPLPPQDEAEAAFRRFYTDPVRTNGALLTAADLVARARAMQATFEDPERELLDLVRTDDKLAFAFRVRGKQVGPLATSAGVLQPTGRIVELRVMDILTVTDGRISDVWTIADELAVLTSLDAVTLTQPT
ncbi:ester cyclase [Nonomuraea zeae]|uniref:Ester cyclase n=1 Tax=Nonomuraea zeae TaxID=1642303 RepID=A0A5S4EZP0_9ACTN|nr:ester cyclase [Nonomuraea zeae]TMR09249.1 ester cyclase [Nonomuraea zeae]